MLVRRRTLLSAALAPLALIIGLVIGAWRQGPRFDSIVDTISALAGDAARDRWIMSSALCVLGSCHVATALGLRAAGKAARTILGVGGVSTLLVAAFPLPARGGSVAHTLSAALAFACLSAWPLGNRAAAGVPPALSPRVSRAAAAALFALLACFGGSLFAQRWVGLFERVVAVAQALWPLCVVLALRRTPRASS